MTTEPSWEDANTRYLAASLDWLRARLDALAATPRVVTPDAEPAPSTAVVPADAGGRRRWGRVRPEEPASEPAAGRARTPTGTEIGGDPSVAELAAVRAAAASPDGTEPPAPPALLQLADRLDLSDFERDVLLLAAAPAIEPGLAGRIADAHGDPAATAPTYALALRLLDDPRWDVLSPERGLRRWRLVEAAGQPLVTAPLRVDERIVNLIRGLDHLDDRVTAAVERVADPAPGVALPASTGRTVDAVVRAVLTETPDGRFPVVQLLGGDTGSTRLVAARAAARLGCELHQLRVGATSWSDELARLWHRESRLRSVVLLLDAAAADPADAGQAEAVRGFLARSGGVLLLAAAEVWPVPDRVMELVDVGRPTPAEQRELWAATTRLPADGVPAVLAGQFRLGVPSVHRIATALRPDLDALRAAAAGGAADRAADDADGGAPVDTEGGARGDTEGGFGGDGASGAEGDGGGVGPADAEERVRELLWAAARTAARPRLEALARRIVPRARWADLVLPAEQLDLLRQLVSQVRHRVTVFSEWGFEQRSARGTGVTALFAGPSGTGKSYAAEVLAGELGLDLYRIDLSAVVDKYIGETEKNLRRVFDAAEDGGALLLFDEADALFGRRSEVRDSHDRYANLEVGYLLQRTEAYDGVAVLATNLRAALDPAFLRRLRFVVDFPVPGPDERRRLWAAAFPPAVPVGELALTDLAELPVTGAAVQAIAVGAAFLAAEEGRPVDTGTVLRAAQVEFRKLDLPVPALGGSR